MKEKIKQAIKASHKDLTLSATRMDALIDKLSKVITDEVDIEATVSSYDFDPYYEIAKSDDKVRNLENQKPKPTEPTPSEQPASNDEALTKALEAINTLNARLDGFEKAKTVTSFKEQLQNELKDAPQFLQDAYLAQVSDSITQDGFNTILETAKSGLEAFKSSQPKTGGVFVAKQNDGTPAEIKADDPLLSNIKI